MTTATTTQLELVDVIDAEVQPTDVAFDPDFDGTYVTDWDYDTAHAETQRIQNHMNEFAENMDELMFDAFSHRVWRAMGYDTWEDWRSSLRVRKSVTERRALTARMHKRGMSTRAIGAALGVSHMTAERDLKVVAAQEDSGEGVTNVPADDIEESEKILGSDGKQYTRDRKAPETTTRRKTHAWMAVTRIEAIEAEVRKIEDANLAYGLDETVTPEVATELSNRIDSAMKAMRALKKALDNRRNEIQD